MLKPFTAQLLLLLISLDSDATAKCLLHGALHPNLLTQICQCERMTQAYKSV